MGNRNRSPEVLILMFVSTSTTARIWRKFFSEGTGLKREGGRGGTDVGGERKWKKKRRKTSSHALLYPKNKPHEHGGDLNERTVTIRARKRVFVGVRERICGEIGG